MRILIFEDEVCLWYLYFSYQATLSLFGSFYSLRGWEGPSKEGMQF